MRLLLGAIGEALKVINTEELVIKRTLTISST